MLRIDGRNIADRVIAGLKKIDSPKQELAFVAFKRSDAFASFVHGQILAAGILGVRTRVIYLAAIRTTQALVAELRQLGADETIGGVVLQLPLPEWFDKKTVLDNIPVGKDVDCLNPATVGSAPAVLAVKKIFEEGHPGFNLEEFHGSKVCLIGAGLLIGRPLARYFESLSWYVAMLNSKSPLEVAAKADLVITGTGVKGLIRPELLKAGVDLIDFGYPGDVAEDSPLLGRLNSFTPSRGGTGPVLVASAFENFYRLTGLLK